MKFIRPHEINSFLGLILSKDRYKSVDIEKLERYENIGISLCDFIKSQLACKVINTGYKTLINCVASVNNSKHGCTQTNQNISSDTHELCIEYIELISTLAIYFELSYGIKIYGLINKEILELLDEESKHLTINDFEVEDNILVYKEILGSKGILVLDPYKNLDYEYLTYNKIILNNAKANIVSIGGEYIC